MSHLDNIVTLYQTPEDYRGNKLRSSESLGSEFSSEATHHYTNDVDNKYMITSTIDVI